MGDESRTNHLSGSVRIDLGAEQDIRAWAQKFGVTEKGLRAAAQRVGDDAEAVRRELGGQGRGPLPHSSSSSL